MKKMNKFSDEHVDIRKLPKGKAMLLAPFSYENDEYKITVLPGFIFDGASIPRFFWRVIGHPFSYPVLRAGLVHDVLYATEYFDREYADQLFADMLDLSGISELKEFAMHKAVRVGGGEVWSTHTEESIVEALKFIKVEVK